MWIIITFPVWFLLKVTLDIALGLDFFTSTVFAALPILCIASLIRSSRSRMRRVQQMQIDAQAVSVAKRVQQGHKVNFTLYLRPFDLSHCLTAKKRRNALWHPYHSDSIEPDGIFQLDEQIRILTGAPTIKIGSILDFVGGGTILTSNDAWKSMFLQLAQQARIIFAIPWPTINSQWELIKINTLNLANKTVLIIPDVKMTGYEISKKDLEVLWIYSNICMRQAGFWNSDGASGFAHSVSCAARDKNRFLGTLICGET